MNRGKIFKFICDERKYQDEQHENKRFQKQTYSVGEELALMKAYLDEALVAYAKKFGDAPALHGIRKVAALAMRCMENHGCLPREEKRECKHSGAKEVAEFMLSQAFLKLIRANRDSFTKERK